MTYTVQLDFHIDENIVRTKEQVEKILEEVVYYGRCYYASNIRVIDVND